MTSRERRAFIFGYRLVLRKAIVSSRRGGPRGGVGEMQALLKPVIHVSYVQAGRQGE
jgi:hypothetical protein